MLVLSRGLKQSIIIDGETEITVLDIRGSYVKLGVNAPPHVKVDRKEIHDKKIAEMLEETDEENDDEA